MNRKTISILSIGAACILSAGTAAACDQRVTIRMRGNAESLNAAVAAAVLMWELQKNR